jgi:hypothetical protein
MRAQFIALPHPICPAQMRLPTVGLRDIMHMLLSTVARLVCQLRGHDFMWHFEPRRVCLHCRNCGTDTPGWTIEINPHFDTGAKTTRAR